MAHTIFYLQLLCIFNIYFEKEEPQKCTLPTLFIICITETKMFFFLQTQQKITVKKRGVKCMRAVFI